MVNLREFVRKNSTHFIAVILFFIVASVYYFPSYQGKSLRQDDLQQWTGMRQSIVKFHSLPENTDKSLAWCSTMFSGMPSYLITAVSSDDGVFYKSIYRFLYSFPAPVSYLFFAMLGFYILMLLLRVNPRISIFAAIAYGLSTYFILIIEVGHITKMWSMIFVAPFLASLIACYRYNTVLSYIALVLFTERLVMANHPQIVYYFLFVILGIIITEFVSFLKRKELNRFILRSLFILITGVIGVLPMLGRYYITNEHGKDTMRGSSEIVVEGSQKATTGLDKDYILSWSYGKLESFNFFVPSLYGGSSMGGFSKNGEVAKALQGSYGMDKKRAGETASKGISAYWGDQPFTNGPTYIGAIFLFFFILSLFVLDARTKMWLISAIVISLLFAWGRNIMPVADLLIDYMPFYNKFRTVAMALVIVQLSIPVLAVLTLDKIYKMKKEEYGFLFSLMRKSLYVIGGIIVSLLIFFPSMSDFFRSDEIAQYEGPLLNAMISERKSMFFTDMGRLVLFILASAGLLYFLVKEKISRQHFVIILTVLAIFDLFSVNFRYSGWDHFVKKDFSKRFEMSPVDKEILKDKELNYRVFNMSVNPFNDAQTSYYHKHIGGYHPAKLSRYQDINDMYLTKFNGSSSPVVNMLNTKYIIFKGKESLSYQENYDRIGPAWIVSHFDLCSTANREIEEIGIVDLRTTAVVNTTQFANEIESASKKMDTSKVDTSKEFIKIDSFKEDLITYSFESDKDRVVVFSEIYYKGEWKLFVDGKVIEMFRANYILRSAFIEKGKHKIEMKHYPALFFKGKKIGFIGSVIFISFIVILVGVYYFRKRKNKIE